MTALLATAFHARTAERNWANAWLQRGAFTVPASFGDVVGETLAARVSAVLADISPREDLHIAGPGAAALLATACGEDIAGLGVTESRRVLWRADGGGLRGAGAIYRFGEADFLLRSFDADPAWFASAAPRFDAEVRDATSERGLLLIAGPYALPALMLAGLQQAATLKAGCHAIYDWGGVRVTLFRRRDYIYQLSCAAAHGPRVFDRLMKRGSLCGLRLAGQVALETLQLEKGIPLPGIDYRPARAAFAEEPLASSLGFPGDADAPGNGTRRRLMGVILESDVPKPFSPILRNGVEIGHSLRSAYSPVLKRAIALAQVSIAHAERGAKVRVTDVAAEIVALPFL